LLKKDDVHSSKIKKSETHKKKPHAKSFIQLDTKINLNTKTHGRMKQKDNELTLDE
jgi:hypothetical protein